MGPWAAAVLEDPSAAWLRLVVYGGFMGFPRVDMLRFREDDATDPTDAPLWGAILHTSVAR